MAAPYYLTPNSRPASHRALRLLLAAAVLAGLLWIALTAVAGCSYNHVFGWASGGVNNTFYSDNVSQCSPEKLTYSRVRIQEKVATFWTTRASDDWTGSTNNAVLVDVYYNCSGHGTDLWRSQAYFTTSTGGSTTSYRPNSGGASYSCP